MLQIAHIAATSYLVYVAAVDFRHLAPPKRTRQEVETVTDANQHALRLNAAHFPWLAFVVRIAKRPGSREQNR